MKAAVYKGTIFCLVVTVISSCGAGGGSDGASISTPVATTHTKVSAAETTAASGATAAVPTPVSPTEATDESNSFTDLGAPTSGSLQLIWQTDGIAEARAGAFGGDVFVTAGRLESSSSNRDSNDPSYVAEPASNAVTFLNDSTGEVIATQQASDITNLFVSDTVAIATGDDTTHGGSTAFGLPDGEVLWSGAPVLALTESSAAVEDFDEEAVVDLKTGQLKRKVDVPGYIIGASGEVVVFLSPGSSVTGFNASTGLQVWTAETRATAAILFDRTAILVDRDSPPGQEAAPVIVDIQTGAISEGPKGNWAGFLGNNLQSIAWCGAISRVSEGFDGSTTPKCSDQMAATWGPESNLLQTISVDGGESIDLPSCGQSNPGSQSFDVTGTVVFCYVEATSELVAVNGLDGKELSRISVGIEEDVRGHVSVIAGDGRVVLLSEESKASTWRAHGFSFQ